MKGKANPIANPNMDTKKINELLLPDAISTNAAPNIGPVQEKETKTVVKAMKNAPKNPPFSLSLSDLLTHLLGIVISNKPKNERAKTIKIIKNKTLGIQCVDIMYIASFPKIRVRSNPSTAKIKTIDSPKA